MSIYKNNDGSVVKDGSGAISTENGTVQSVDEKIVHIDTDLQIPNQILKDDSNNVSQVTDKAQGIAFAGNCTYNYDDYLEFDGVDSQLNSTPQNIWARNSLYIEIDFAITDTSRQYQYIVVSANSSISADVNFRIYYDNVNKEFNLELYRPGGILYTSSEITLTENEFIKLAFFFIGDVWYIIEGNTILSAVSASMTGVNTNTAVVSIGAQPWTVNDFSLIGNVRSFIIADETNTYYPSKPFSYIKRFKKSNAETYLSVKYLKDCVIDSSNKIERINNAQSDTYFEQLTPANQPTITDSGILFASGESLVQASSDQFTYGLNDAFFGAWIDFQNLSDAITIGTAFKIGIDATNIYVETTGGKLYLITTNAINEGYKFIAFHIHDGSLHISKNGRIENSRVEAIDYSTDQACTLGGNFIGLIDCLVNSKSKVERFIAPNRTTFDDFIEESKL